MTRGNQRDLARAKNAKKNEKLKKQEAGAGTGNDLTKRKERDADVMREKQKKAEEKRQMEAGGGPPPPAEGEEQQKKKK